LHRLTHIKVVATAFEVQEFDARSDESLISAIASHMGNMPLEDARVVSLSSNEPVVGWKDPKHMVGTEDLAVELPAMSFMDMFKSVLGKELTARLVATEEKAATELATVTARLEEKAAATEEELTARLVATEKAAAKQKRELTTQKDDLAELASPRIINAAAQVCNHARGSMFKSSKNTMFDEIRKDNQGDVWKQFESLSMRTGKSVDNILTEASRIVNERNNKRVHFASPAALEAEVRICMGLIRRHPKLKRTHPRECWVILNFVHFKAAFRDKLG
jgi:hypothetical protein